jgi:hypothetical protein
MYQVRGPVRVGAVLALPATMLVEPVSAENIIAVFNGNVDLALGSIAFIDADRCDRQSSYLCDILGFYCHEKGQL